MHGRKALQCMHGRLTVAMNGKHACQHIVDTHAGFIRTNDFSCMKIAWNMEFLHS